MTLDVCLLSGKTKCSVSSRRSKKGFTLTEIAIVLGIIGLILGAIWVAASSVYSNLRVSKTTTQLISIVQATRSLYSTSPTTGETTNLDETANWIKAGVFPADMINGTAAKDAWNGSVYSFSGTITTTGDAFELLFDAVPTSACISLLTSTTGTGRDAGLQLASAKAAGGTAYVTIPTTPTTMPITAGTAAGATVCGLGTTVELVWGFKLKG